MATDRPVALVTGSGSGIGTVLARRLADEGYAVVAHSRSSVKAGEALAASLPDGHYIRADLAVAAECDRLVAETLERHGRLDLLVNNAGTGPVIPHADLQSATAEVWDEVLKSNLVAPFLLVRAAEQALRGAPDGHVINIGSVAGLRAIGSSVPYGVSKAGLHHLTLQLAAAIGPVRVNAIAPGFIETPRTESWDAARAGTAALTPLRRTGVSDDVVEAVLGLIRGTYQTGCVIVVDGGLTLKS